MEPIQISAFYHRLEKNAADWIRVNGWKCAQSFEDPETEKKRTLESLGICDISHFFKREFAGRDAKACLENGGFPVPTPTGYSLKDKMVLCPSSSQTFLLWAETTIPEIPIPQGACLHVTDRTAGLAALLIMGPKSPDFLSGLVPIDVSLYGFQEGRSALCGFARVPAILIRKDVAGMPAYQLLITREYGDYIWRAIEEAREFCSWNLFGERTRRMLEGDHA